MVCSREEACGSVTHTLKNFLSEEQSWIHHIEKDQG